MSWTTIISRTLPRNPSQAHILRPLLHPSGGTPAAGGFSTLWSQPSRRLIVERRLRSPFDSVRRHQRELQASSLSLTEPPFDDAELESRAARMMPTSSDVVADRIHFGLAAAVLAFRLRPRLHLGEGAFFVMGARGAWSPGENGAGSRSIR